jgi:hypothetical protein
MAVLHALRAWRETRGILKNPPLLALIIPALLNVIVFSVPELHVARYVFPATTLLILFFLAYAAHALSLNPDKNVKYIVLTYVILFIGLNVIQNVGWLRMVYAGPAERATIVPQLLSWQEENPESRALMLKGWPLGVVHTNEAYRDFVERYSKGDSELWQYIINNLAPDDVAPLDVYYVRDEESFAKEKGAYDFAVRHHLPQTGDDVSILSPTDEFEIRPWNVWRYKKYQESFEIVQE